MSKVCSGRFRQFFFSFWRQKKWSLVALDRWLSYTVTIAWELAWADSTLAVFDEWSSYRGGRLSRFDCTSKEKIYQELGLESLESRRWFKKLCFFFKNLKNKSPDYLFRIIPQRRSSYIKRNSYKIPLFKIKLNFYKNGFFLSTTIEWNNLDQDLRNSESYTLFHSSILKFIRPPPNSFYGCQNIMGIKLVTRLHLGLSNLQEHKFKHSFQDTLNRLCNCGMDIESSTYFLFQCPLYINERCTLVSNLNRICAQISQLSLQLLKNTLPFGNLAYSDKTNTHILNATIDYIRLTKRFDEPLFLIMCFAFFFFHLYF